MDQITELIALSALISGFLVPKEKRTFPQIKSDKIGYGVSRKE